MSSDSIYATKHIETRLKRLHELINMSPSYPEHFLSEYDQLLMDLGRIKLAERLGLHPQTLTSDRIGR